LGLTLDQLVEVRILVPQVPRAVFAAKITVAVRMCPYACHFVSYASSARLCYLAEGQVKNVKKPASDRRAFLTFSRAEQSRLAA